jgi:endonuclease/exonuclease/phosphatase family metal-dependent hydrolase
MRKLFILLIFSCCALFVTGQQVGLKVMTFNIRYDNPGDGDYTWQKRIPLVKELLQQEQPDIMGFQEALKNQVDGLQGLLPGHSWSGVGRDDGKEKGEYSVIFYRKNRFKKVDGSTFWLSETPGVPGSRSWNTACTRIVTWVKLKDQNSNRFLFVFNTHFDHASPTAREESAKLLQKKISEIARNTSTIITGDFNDTVSSIPIQTLTSGPEALVNTRNLSSTPPEGPDYSFIGFPFNPQKGNVIDMIFLKNKGKINVIRHRVVTYHKDGKYPSDHLPVCTELEIPIR